MKKLKIFAMMALIAGPAWTKDIPVYEQTGTIEISFGEKQLTHFTAWNTVPGDPDRQIHTASWLILEPREMGGINIMPDDVFVAISSRDAVEPGAGQSSMSVEFSLDPETLALRAKPAPTIRFHPDNAEHYTLTNGVLEVHSVTRTEAGNLEISATARGQMVRQTDDGADHNDAQEFRAKFDLRNVAGRGTIPLP